jgi:outer membrane lipoprotein-sorting protein
MRSTLPALLAGAALLAAGPIRSDEKSDALLKKARETVAAAKTLEADLVATMKFGGREATNQGTVRLMKPNLGEIKLSGPNQAPGQTVVSTGKELFIGMEAAKQYRKLAAHPQGRDLGNYTGPAGALFLAPMTVGVGGTTRYLGMEKVGDAAYEVVELTRTGGRQVEKLYFNAKGLLQGSEVTVKNDQPDQTLVRSFWLKNIRLDTGLKAEQFAYTPPADFKLYEPPDLNALLLPVGKEAPSFRLPQPAGAGELALEDTLKGKKAVLINFWFYN